MCVELHKALCGSATMEQYVLRGIRARMMAQVQEPNPLEIYAIHTQLECLEDTLGINDRGHEL